MQSKQHRMFYLVFLVLVLVAVTLAGGCGGSEDTGAGSKTYTIADETGDWGYPSPYGHYARGPGYVRMSLIFDTLVWKDQEGFVPALAEKWEYIEEENAYLFDLRQDVKWHDGEPFDAEDVVFTFRYIKKHPYSWVDATKIKDVEAAGPYKVKISLTQPYAPFLSNVAGTMPVLPEHVYREIDEPETYRGDKALVGTGPFKLVDYSKEHGSYLYTANKDYYAGQPAVEKLKFIKVSREMVAAALAQGKVNAAEVPPETVAGLKEKDITVIRSPYQWNAKLLFNHRRPPFDDRLLRQAIGYAVDRQALVDIVLRGYGRPASPGMLPPDSPWYNPEVKPYTYALEKAGELLQAAGYKKEGEAYVKNGRPLAVTLLTSARFAREAEMIKQQLARAGIKVEVRSLEAKTVDTRIANWEFELALSGHGGLGGDPEMLNRLIIGKGFNSARYENNQRLVELLRRQVGEMDPETRRDLVHQIQELYAGELPALSLYYPDWFWAHDQSLSLYYTPGGIALGVPLPLNKLCFVH